MKNVTKILSVILVLAVVALSFAGCAQKTGDKLEYKIENNEVTITGYTDNTDRFEIVVPDEIEGYPVTKIADFGLFNAETLETITIGKNVKEIGAWAMTNNQHLKQFVVSEENEYFTAVDGILFTKDMKEIVYYPNARGVTFSKYGEPEHRDSSKDDFVRVSYDIPEGVEKIRSKAFYKCYYIDDITIPDSVKTIEEKAFHRCSALTAITLPSSLEYIGKDAFAYCELIEEITIPASVKEIADYAFFDCKNITSVVIESDSTAIELGNKWYPTIKGDKNKECKITDANGEVDY